MTECLKENGFVTSSKALEKSTEVKNEKKTFTGELKGEDVYYILLQEPSIEPRVYVTNKYSEFKTTADKFLTKFVKDGRLHNRNCDPGYAYCVSNKDKCSYECSNFLKKKLEDDFIWEVPSCGYNFNWLPYLDDE